MYTVSTRDPALWCHVYIYAITRGTARNFPAQYKVIGTELNNPGLHGALRCGAHLK